MAGIALLANLDAGRGAAADAVACLASLAGDIRRYSLEEVDAAIHSRPERIVVAGGDGSIGRAADAARRARVPLAVIPVGTANDFARALGVPMELRSACEVAVRGRRARRFELGWIGDRPFVNAASAGLSPLAARNATGLKRVFGPLAYSVGALRAATTAEPIACRVACGPDPVFSGRAWQVTVGVTGAFGGGAEIDADPADGALDVLVIEAGSRARLARHAYGLRAGRIEAQPGTSHRRASEVVVDTDGSTGFNVDGELVDGADFRFTVEPDAYEVVLG